MLKMLKECDSLKDTFNLIVLDLTLISDKLIQKYFLVIDKLISSEGYIFVKVKDIETKVLLDTTFLGYYYISTFPYIYKEDCQVKCSYLLCYSKVNFFRTNSHYVNQYIESRITNFANCRSTLLIKKGTKCEESITKIFTGVIGGKKEPIEILNKEGMIIENGVLQNDVYISGHFRNPNYIKNYYNDIEVIDKKGQRLVEVYIKNSGIIYTKKERFTETQTNIINLLCTESKK